MLQKGRDWSGTCKKIEGKFSTPNAINHGSTLVAVPPFSFVRVSFVRVSFVRGWWEAIPFPIG